MALRVFIGNLKFAASQRELAGALEALVPGLRPVQVQIWRRGQYRSHFGSSRPNGGKNSLRLHGPRRFATAEGHLVGYLAAAVV